MEGGQSGRQLPEHIVEIIIAMMPFPSIFKAKMLSKAWLTRFSPTEFCEGGRKETLGAKEFQKLVSERAKTWEILGPVCSRDDHDECHVHNKARRPCNENCYAYNRASQTWQRIPSRPVIPILTKPKAIVIEGALMLLPRDADYYDGRPRRARWTDQLYVANILTRNCKLLPARPILGEVETIDLANIVLNMSMQTYKVVLFDQVWIFNRYEFWVQIFDSVSCSWRHKELFDLPHLKNLGLSKAVYFNGALYLTACTSPMFLIAFDMEEEKWTELSLGELTNPEEDVEHFQSIVACEADLFIIFTRLSHTKETTSFRVMKADLSLGSLSLVTESPPRSFESSISSYPVIDYDLPIISCGGCIYFGAAKQVGHRSAQQMPVYNVREDCWSCVSMCPDGLCTNGYFQPGLCPFIAV